MNLVSIKLQQQFSYIIKNTSQQLGEDEYLQAFKTDFQTSDQENYSKSGEEDDMNENSNDSYNRFINL